MRDELRINQLTPQGFAWYTEYLRAVDSRDLEAYGRLLAEDCAFQFGNNTVVSGRQAIIEGLRRFWATYDGEEHVLLNILGDDRCFALEAVNIFRRKDGASVSIPAVAVTERDDAGLASSVRVFIDIAPLYADGRDSE